MGMDSWNVIGSHTRLHSGLGPVTDTRVRNSLTSTITAVLVSVLIPLGAAGQPIEGDAPKPPLLTVESIEARLLQAQEKSTLDEAGTAKLTQFHAGAIEQLRLERDWKQKAAQFEDDRLQAPDRVKEIEAQLSKPPEGPKPAIPESASLSDLNLLLAQAEAELATAVSQQTELQGEPGRRAERRKRLPELVSDTNKRLEETRAQLAAPGDTSQPPELVEARRLQTQARIQAIEAEKDAYDKELRSYEARGQLLSLRQDLAARQVSEAQKIEKEWRDTVTSFREQEAARAVVQAKEALALAETVNPLVRDVAQRLAEENNQLAARQAGPEGLIARIEKTTRIDQGLDRELTRVETGFKDVKAKAKTVQLTEALGLLLRQHRRALPDRRAHRSNLRKRTELIGEAQFAQLELQDEREKLADIENLVYGMVDELAPSANEEQREILAGVFRDLLHAKRSNLDALLANYGAYIDILIRTQLKEQQLNDKTEEFSAYIRERVLWIRSGDPLGISDAVSAGAVLLWFAEPSKRHATLRALGLDLVGNPVEYGAAFVLVVLLVLLRRRAKRRLRDVADSAKKPTCVALGPTAEALLATAMIGVLWPAILWFIGWRLAQATESGQFEKALGWGLSWAALVLLTFEFPRQVLRRGGLGEAHFGWPQAPTRIVRRHVAWLMIAVTLASCIVFVLDQTEDERYTETLGRILFIAAMACYAAFGHFLMRTKCGPIPMALRRSRGSRERNLDRLWHVLAVGVPVALLIAASAGYFFTSLRLAWRFHGTLCFGIGLLVLRGLVLRWLLLTRRRLAREQARKRREALKAQASEGVETNVPNVPEEEADLDLAKVDVRTHNLVRSGVFIALLIGVWFIWSDVFPALGVFDRVELWTTTRQVSGVVENAAGEQVRTTREDVVPVTLSHLGLAALIALMTLAVARNLPSLLEVALLQRLPLVPGERYAVTTLVGYVVFTIGAVLVFNVMGVGWGKVQWLVAAMGVGLGFGLQEIFANVISGLIILFEQPIRVGDTVTIGGVNGTVSKIRIRATRILDWDRKELIVPNKEFVTGQLVNWTLSDSILRLIIPVGIAYGSDTERALRVLYGVAEQHPLVLQDPSPQVLFVKFGDSSLNFELRVYCPSVDVRLQASHELHLAIDKAFREAGIEIAFPQRDIHVRTIRDCRGG